MTARGEKDRVAGVAASHGWRLASFRRQSATGWYRAVLQHKQRAARPDYSTEEDEIFVAPLDQMHRAVFAFVARRSGVYTNDVPLVFRVRDILHHKTLLTSTRPSDVMHYMDVHYRRGHHEWRVEYLSKSGGWSDVPPEVRRRWHEKQQAEGGTDDGLARTTPPDRDRAATGTPDPPAAR